MKQTKAKGITLIALVITIIVLLILVGISIAMLTGENRILTKATEAKEQYAYKNAEEKVKLAVVEYQVKMREDLLKGNGTYQVKVVGKNRKRAISQELSVTEVQVKISGTLKVGEVIEGSVLLTITGEATGTNIEKIEIYKGETTKIGEIPIEGEEMQVTKTYETANMVFYEETNYSAKIIASTKEWAFTNTVKCINSNTIRTRADLQKLSEVVEEGNNFRGKNIKVVEDINIQNVEMKPIGTPDVPFEGNFDGNFKTISNIVFRGFLHGYYGSNTGNAK